jgi:hypothetical protein
MNQTTETHSLPLVPPEVKAFAREQGVGAVLPAVLSMSRRILPRASMAVVLEDDPELASDRHITIEADVTGLSVSDIVARQNQWSDELFQLCPAMHAHLFRIAMV